jgi:RNA polymerase sigma-70 factor, ECF subfamily
MAPSDTELVDEARAGDGRAFGELVRRHDGLLRALAFGLLGSRDAMDDALQDAYLKAHRGLAGFRGDASVRTWLYGITYRTCIDHLRAGSRRPTDPLDDQPEARLARRANVDGAIDDRLRLQAALDGLSPDHRAVVLAVDLAGFTYDELAEHLGIAPGTVASRLSRARAALRAVLDEPRTTTGEGPS